MVAEENSEPATRNIAYGSPVVFGEFSESSQETKRGVRTVKVSCGEAGSTTADNSQVVESTNGMETSIREWEQTREIITGRAWYRPQGQTEGFIREG